MNVLLNRLILPRFLKIRPEAASLDIYATTSLLCSIVRPNRFPNGKLPTSAPLTKACQDS